MQPAPIAETREAAIAAMQALAVRLGRRPRRDEFCRATGLSRRTARLVCGTYGELIRAAGLMCGHTGPGLTDDDLLGILRDGLTASAGSVGRIREAPLVRRHRRAIVGRWRGWTRALLALRDWLACQQPDHPDLPALSDYCRIRRVVPVSLTPSCGELLRFRALDHAPTSESAVIFLFGLVAEELGFVLESLGPSFPDASGRRRVEGGWQRVRIEFEHRSRNFHAHAHDPKACDLIVCWEHNWPDCPLEVLELKREIARMMERASITLGQAREPVER